MVRHLHASSGVTNAWEPPAPGQQESRQMLGPSRRRQLGVESHLGENSFHPAATDLVFPRIHLSDTVVVPAFTGFAGVGDW